MTKITFTLPHWAQVEFEPSNEQISFILDLINFIGSWENMPGKRLRCTSRGMFIWEYNVKSPWHYTPKGMGIAKEAIRRLRAAAQAPRVYLDPTSAEVQAVADAYLRLGWGNGMGGQNERDFSSNGEEFRFVRRGRWYSLDTANIRAMAAKAAKAERILAIVRRPYALDDVPAHLRPLCLDMRKYVRMDEESGRILTPGRYCDPTPQGVKEAKLALAQHGADLLRNIN